MYVIIKFKLRASTSLLKFLKYFILNFLNLFLFFLILQPSFLFIIYFYFILIFAENRQIQSLNVIPFN